MNRKLLFAVPILLSIALFFAARERQSWQPEKIAFAIGTLERIRVSPDGRWLAFVSRDRFQLFDWQKQEPIVPKLIEPTLPHNIVFSRGGREFFVLTEFFHSQGDSQIGISRISSSEPRRSSTFGVTVPNGHSFSDSPFELSRDGQTLFCGGFAWDVKTKRLRARPTLEELDWNYLPPDSAKARRSDDGGILREKDLKTGKERIIRLKGFSPDSSGRFSPSGRTVFFNSSQGQFVVVEFETGQPRWMIPSSNQFQWLLSPTKCKSLFLPRRIGKSAPFKMERFSTNCPQRVFFKPAPFRPTTPQFSGRMKRALFFANGFGKSSSCQQFL